MGKKFNRKLNKKFKLFLISIAVIGAVIVNIPHTYSASTASLSFNGSGKATTGQTFTEDIMVTAISGSGLMGAQGSDVTSSDPSCVSIQSIAKIDPLTTVGKNKNTILFAVMDSADARTSNVSVARVTLKAGTSACKTNINLVGSKISFADGTKLTLGTITKEITVGEAEVEPPPAEKNKDATLKNLTVDKGTLSPSFNPNTTGYNVEVGSDVTSITLTATKNDAKATISGGGSCKLNATGKTACSVTVTAEDGTKKTYTVNVTKKDNNNPGEPPKEDPKDDPKDDPTPETPAKSNDASLKSLEVEGQRLNPSFSSSEDSYTLKIPNSVNDLKVNAIANNPNATVTVTGANNLREGVNPIRITVKAEDGTTRVYVINVIKGDTSSSNSSGGSSGGGSKSKSSDNFLKNIIATNGDLNPSFSSSTSSYSIVVPNEVTSLDLKAIVNDSRAKVNISGNENFKVGLNVVTIEVEAEDGSLRIYTINVTRSDISGETKLKDLSVGGASLFPTFNPDMYEYTISVDNNVDKLNISAIPVSPNSKVEIIGNENLKEGNNTVLVKVTDENGFVQYYRLNVNKSSKKKFLGLTLGWWLAILGLLLLLGFIIILILLFRRKKDKEEPKEDKTVIEFKPEINIGSKNGTDDDYVEAGGTINQFAGSIPEGANKVIKEAQVKEIPYDLYDDIVTKDELFDALQEANEKKDNSKLKMLYAQEMLNRKKEEMRKKENK